jgi:hypothetical protein
VGWDEDMHQSLVWVKNVTGLDRAIFFTILARSWSAVAGTVTVALIARFLSPAEQGYYYTFASLVAAQVVFELGFSFVILQMAAHERARLSRFDNIAVEGDPIAVRRLGSLFQKAIRWYTRLAVFMAVSVTIGGILFFHANQQRSGSIKWLLPWILDVLAASLMFQIDPIISFLEGCGWVSSVARMRFFQAVFGSLLAWGCLAMHHGLFSPAFMILGQATIGLVFLIKGFGGLLRFLYSHDSGSDNISWRNEIWPFQWRIAVSWACAYLIFQLFNPVVFVFQGPVMAGRVGMSLSICNSVAAIALSWISTKAAIFGTHVAKKQIYLLDRLFQKVVVQSTSLLFFAQTAVITSIYVVTRYVPHFASRIIPIPDFIILSATFLLSHVVICIAYYIRAHKQEAFIFYWVLIAAFSCLAITFSCKWWGVLGVTIAYLISGGLLRLAAAIYVFLDRRRVWYGRRYMIRRRRDSSLALE